MQVMLADWLGAADTGNIDLLLKLLANGADIDARDQDGRTALMRAAEARQARAVEALLGKGAAMEIEDNMGWTAMTWSVTQAAEWLVRRRGLPGHNPDRGAMDVLVAAGARCNLREAVALGDTGLAQRISQQRSIEINGEAGFFAHETFLMLAARSGSTEMVRFLIDHGAEVSGMDDLGYTALMVASQEGHASVVEFLVDRGADVNAGWPSETALSVAEASGREDVVSLLLSRGAKRRLVDAIELGDAALTAQLLRGGVNADFIHVYSGRDAAGSQEAGYCVMRVAMRAAGRGDTEIVRLLLDHGASHHMAHFDERALVAEAARHGRAQVVRLLIERGADLNAVGTDGMTALQWAERAGHLAIALELKRAGAIR
jgi:serine/threonine-protein phosphatase 6 regulatory ankyrin repeat subunit B